LIPASSPSVAESIGGPPESRLESGSVDVLPSLGPPLVGVEVLPPHPKARLARAIRVTIRSGSGNM
jgi:hypothetical protein